MMEDRVFSVKLVKKEVCIDPQLENKHVIHKYFDIKNT